MNQDNNDFKYCPLIKDICIGDKCIAYGNVRMIVPFYIKTILEKVKNHYKNIETILYDGIEVTTFEDEYCTYFNKSIRKKGSKNE